MKMATMKSGLGALALLPGLAMAAPAVADKADNAFMMICTALVLFMTIPGIALFYGGLIRGKNVLSMLTQVAVTFALVCVLWVVYGYSLAFGEGNAFFGNFNWAMLKNIELTALMGSFYQYIHVAFQGSFACITVGLIVGALAERIRFSAVLIFVVVWLTLSYVPIAHMVWGGGLLATHGALDFAGGSVQELPPNGQGIATLIALGILEQCGIEKHHPDSVQSLHLSIEAMKLALADLDRYVADEDHMAFAAKELLSDHYLKSRAALINHEHASDFVYGSPTQSGTVYISTADASGMMVSFIQSNYMGFGSGIVVPDTGISLQNRGCGFVLDPNHPNALAGSKRPFHTIIPGFAMDGNGQPLMSFGVMGGPMQAQGHMQMALRIMLHGQNPQAAIDAPRWRVVQGREVIVESTFDRNTIAALRERGHQIVVEDPLQDYNFGGAQVIYRLPEGHYVAATESRKDGQALVS